VILLVQLTELGRCYNSAAVQGGELGFRPNVMESRIIRATFYRASRSAISRAIRTPPSS
jgi:hypothetical protein